MANKLCLMFSTKTNYIVDFYQKFMQTIGTGTKTCPILTYYYGMESYEFKNKSDHNFCSTRNSKKILHRALSLNGGTNSVVLTKTDPQ